MDCGLDTADTSGDFAESIDEMFPKGRNFDFAEQFRHESLSLGTKFNPLFRASLLSSFRACFGVVSA